MKKFRRGQRFMNAITDAISPIQVTAINAVGATGAVVVACDVPSGVDASTGEITAQAVQADHTVTLTTPSGELTFPFEQIDRANLKFEW